MLTLAVDPGKKTGWALFRDSILVRCGTCPSGKGLPDADTLVIEEPRIRRRHPRPEDIIQLAVLVGGIAAKYKHVRRIKPEVWKGQLPKDVCWRRAAAHLTQKELVCVCAAGRISGATDSWIGLKLDHNCRDAIALGLWALGRF